MMLKKAQYSKYIQQGTIVEKWIVAFLFAQKKVPNVWPAIIDHSIDIIPWWVEWPIIQQKYPRYKCNMLAYQHRTKFHRSRKPFATNETRMKAPLFADQCRFLRYRYRRDTIFLQSMEIHSNSTRQRNQEKNCEANIEANATAAASQNRQRWRRRRRRRRRQTTNNSNKASFLWQALYCLTENICCGYHPVVTVAQSKPVSQ